MGERRDKGKRVARYLTGITGIPSLTWTPDNIILAPSPYTITLVTNRSMEEWSKNMRVDDPMSLRINIRYDNSMGVDEAWVGMNLRTFAPLLTAHYDNEVRPRLENQE